MPSAFATLDRLELATRAYHSSADRTWSCLLAPEVTTWQYVRRLVSVYGFEAPVEAALAYTPHFKLVFDLPWWFRAGLIAQDLLALGITAAEIARLPQCAAVAPFVGPLEACGWFYVLARSTLVQARVRRHLVARLPDARRAVAYLSAYDGAAHERRCELGAMLDRIVRSPRMLDDVVAAADAAFRCLDRWLPDERVVRARGA
jgi:heme oxygenase